MPLAVCSTSNERAVETIVRVMLGPHVAQHMRVFAGPPARPPPRAALLGRLSQSWPGPALN